jgi:nitrogen-specific signal transduction histidine kinase
MKDADDDLPSGAAQVRLFDALENDVLLAVLDAIPDPIEILDGERRVIHANAALRRLLNCPDTERLRGRRTGDILGCIHSHDCPDGCGECAQCSFCGANDAIRKALETGRSASAECRLTALRDSLFVSQEIELDAHPFPHDGQTWLLVTLRDIGHEKRRQALEKIFFHDIINTASGLGGLLDLMREVQDPGELRHLADEVSTISRNLIEEIQGQKELTMAENGELTAFIDHYPVGLIVREAAHVVGRHPDTVHRRITIEIDPIDPDLAVHTDRGLLMRVLINMLRNAVEASRPQSEVNLYVRCSGNQGRRIIRFCVHNEGHMPQSVQFQLFQRSFSTKGKNRGLGTYSMKLLTERYLKGRVMFESAPETGTTFMVELEEA